MSDRKPRVRKCDHGMEWDMCDICKPAPSELAPARGYAAYVDEAMDYIIKETQWAGHFPKQCLDRIRKTCEAVKAGEPLPHNGEVRGGDTGRAASAEDAISRPLH